MLGTAAGHEQGVGPGQVLPQADPRRWLGEGRMSRVDPSQILTFQVLRAETGGCGE